MKKWTIACLVLIGILILVKTNIISPLDKQIYDYVSLLQSPKTNQLIINITNLGSGTFYGIICVLLIVFKRRLGLVLTLNSSFGFLMNCTLKNIVQRPRPIDRLAVETGFSFPSSHTTCSVMFYGMLGIMFAHSNLKYKKAFSYASWAMIPIIAFTRVYLHVHYFSDVLAGAVFGGILLAVMYEKVFKKMLDY